MICPYCTGDNQIEALGGGRFRCDCCSKAWEGLRVVHGTLQGPTRDGATRGPASPRALPVHRPSAAWDRDLVHQVPTIVVKHGRE
jgi:hypothetical protein